MTFYFDTSAIVPIFIREEQTGAIVSWLEAAMPEPGVSDLAVAEFRSQLSRRIRKGELTTGRADELHDTFDRWRDDAKAIEHVPADIRVAARLVRTPWPKLLTPDGIHLATCARLRATLVTYDQRLIDAAERESVPSLSPS